MITYRLTDTPDAIQWKDDSTGACGIIPKTHRWWSRYYEPWLAKGNTPEPEFTKVERESFLDAAAREKYRLRVLEEEFQSSPEKIELVNLLKEA